MKFLSSFFVLPALALAGPLSRPRGSGQPARLLSVSTSGSGCPSGTVATETSPDGLVTTVGFDNYSTNIGPGVASENREKFCDLTVTVRFPLGCTAVSLATTYHGFAQLDSGVTASLTSSYTLSTGVLAGGNPPTTVLSSTQFGEGDVYTKQDPTSSTVIVRNANEQNVSFVARIRIFLVATNGTVAGLATADDATIAIARQSKC